MIAAKNIKYFLSQVMGRLYVPPELCGTTEHKVLHLSDTPTSLYSAIGCLVNTLKPEVIIHTGDLADDIKLEHNAHRIDLYDQAVEPLIKMLENSSADKICIIPGNHDDVDVISGHIAKTELLTEGQVVEINNYSFGLAHRLKRLPPRADYKLYGHNFKRPLKKMENEVYLNGIQSINVILLPSNEVVKIPYTWGTNRDRKMGDRYMLPNTI
ncbi:metallophosphoesterase [Peptococcaceae bacterium 1198_IL3148]